MVTGVSGSGKSSLAFDTLYAEGQRRYAESLSTYARQFLERLDRPDVDSIEPVPPAIALEQKNGVRNARSTVGTQTEIHDALRLLFAHGGTTSCPDCGVAAVPGGVDRAVEELCAAEAGRARDARGAGALARAGRGGRRQAGASGGQRRRAPRGVPPRGVLPRRSRRRARPSRSGRTSRALLDAEGRLPLVVGRFVVSEAARPEIAAAAETAFALAGTLEAAHGRSARASFGAGSTVRAAGASSAIPTPPMFAFNSPLGACPACQGFGRVIGVDLEKAIPDRQLTLAERPVAPWNTPAYESAYDDLFRACRRYSVRTDVPVARLSAHEREVLIEGRGDFYGVRGFFDWLETKRYKIHVRVLLARYRAYTPCVACGGARLAPPALWVRFRGRTIAELPELPLRDLQRFLRRARLRRPPRRSASARCSRSSRPASAT